jgi:hypothetical protein
VAQPRQWKAARGSPLGARGGALLVLAVGLRVDSGNYGLVTGMKPDGVVAVTVGLASLVSGAA